MRRARRVRPEPRRDARARVAAAWRFRSVLVVDDEASMRHLLSVILTDHGCEARAVATAEDALRELAARDYDLVLTDVRMPGMDGLELLARDPAAPTRSSPSS